MKILNIDKKTNTVLLDYNNKDTLVADICGFFYCNGKLYCKVKLPNWCCNGEEKDICVDNVLEIKIKEQL